MQIITVEDQDFEALVDALIQSHEIGKIVKDGTTVLVKAHQSFLLVADQDSPESISIQPTRSLDEAEFLARDYLERASEGGSTVVYAEAIV